MQPWHETSALSGNGTTCLTCGTPQPPHSHDPMAPLAQRLEHLEARVHNMPWISHPWPQQSEQDDDRGRHHTSSPAEHTVWGGRPTLFSSLPGLLWSVGWLVGWALAWLHSHEVLQDMLFWLPLGQVWLAGISPNLSTLVDDGMQWLETAGRTDTVVQGALLLLTLV
jgi:hypothetical protein